MPASSNSFRTFSVCGSHTCSVYLSKNSPLAYFDFSKPLNAEPRSIAILFDARSAW